MDMRKQTRVLYEFGSFRLDVDERLLMRDGRMAPLPPKVFETLLVLVENSGRVVSKDELMQSLWPDTFVEESNLTQNISQLRRALGDGTGGVKFIETIPKRGYRFVADVQPLVEPVRVNGADVLQPAAGEFSLEAAGGVNGHGLEPAAESISAGGPAVGVHTLPSGVEDEPEKLNRGRLAPIAVLLFVSLAIVIFALVVASRRDGKGVAQPGNAFQQITFSKLTTSGNALLPAISPDGKFVAYVAAEGDLQSLWVRQVVANSGAQVVAPSEVVFKGLTFARDNNFIYYVARRKTETSNKLFQVPLLGGAAREIMAEVDSPITFSPNGRYFAFVRNYPVQRETALIVAATGGSEERKLAVRKRPDALSLLGPSWSPDGRLIACASGTGGYDVPSMQVLAVSVEDGSSMPIGSQTWTFIGEVGWLGDGSGVVLRAWQRAWGIYGDQIWLLTFPKGEARRVTNDMSNYGGAGVSTNSAPSMLVTKRTDRVSRIWVLSHEAGVFEPDPAKGVESGFGDNYSEHFGLDWTPDGSLVYASHASGNVDIWTTTADGKQRKQLTRDPMTDITPVVTPDGRYIVFASERAGGSHIWRMDADGGGLKQLTRGKGDYYPSLSPDGRWVVYASSNGAEHSIWKVPIEGGEPAQLSADVATRPIVSPDGKWIACFYLDRNDAVFKAALIPFTGGAPAVIEEFAQAEWNILRWSPDSRAINYISTRQGASNIWSKPVDGGPARQLTNFTSDRIFRFAWSRDGKFLACERGMIINDAVLIMDQK
jgi:Tol biopolymer transport system component/DNA-binding winged helix-turn-helix (wHTH) protein